MYNSKLDWVREGADASGANDTRTAFRKDYARLIHSTSFRRLTGKTQLFPGPESDYFRNRLTHSLEVAQIAKSIAMRLNEKAFKSYPLNLDLMEFSALAHDLGHPPFGHIGESALDSCMKEYGGFEGNAQTLRILSKIEKKIKDKKANDIGFYRGTDLRYGLNLTYRTLASIIKYDKEIPLKRKDEDKLAKGYYGEEKALVQRIKEKISDGYIYKNEFKTIECQIMDIADDIAYSTFDLEDAFKANFITPLDFLAVSPDLEKKIFEKIQEKGELKSFELKNVLEILSALIKQYINPKKNQAIKGIDLANPNAIYVAMGASFSLSKTLTDNGYNRYQFSSALINEFINGIELKKINKKCPALSEIRISEEVKAKIEVLKYFIFYSVTMSPRLKMPEYRGYEIVETIFKILTKEKGFQLLPNDYRQIYEQIDSKEHKMRTICDFIAGMTDRYVIEFYGRLKSENPQTIFKPY